jgi:hypothetical protein
MTYVINLGVPPLLFTQVLYGRALYTSSVLVGVFWIAVIFLLIACYQLLYTSVGRDQKGLNWWLPGLGSLILALTISKIYSANMALALRPEVWVEMYHKSQLGALFPVGDPSFTPRWAYMMIMSLCGGGVYLGLLSCSASLPDPTRQLLRRTGTLTASLFALVALWAGPWAASFQPEYALQAIQGQPFYVATAKVWAGTTLAIAALAAVGYLTTNTLLLRWLIPLAAFLQVVAMVVWRDGLRDAILLQKGLDVWSRQCVPNWQIVGLFFVVFVLGLVAFGWLVKVALSAKSPTQPARP